MRTLRHSSGQATTEYILIVVLVAILSIGIITTFGNQVRDLYKVATGRLSGVQDPQLTTVDPTIAEGGGKQVHQGLPDLRESGN